MALLPAPGAVQAEPAPEGFLEKARALRPFYFYVVVWGRHFCDYLLNFGIPALLSPNNIPALANRGKNRFLVATTDEDWECMRATPIFRLLESYVEPVFVRIPPCPRDVPSVIHMGTGHKLVTDLAFEHRAYAVHLTPDLMLSDGSLAAAQKHAVNGVNLVLVAALRFAEEPLFEHLGRLGVASLDSRFGYEGRPLVATARQLVAAGVRGMHSETLCYEWEKPWFAPFPSAAWWDVPGEDGIIVHSFSWAPLLVDYDAVAQHDTWAMENWTIDGDYMFRNFGLKAKLYVVQDSDESMLVSWSPLADRPQALEPRSAFAARFTGHWARGHVLYNTMIHPAIDPLKRSLFRLPVYWHARELDRDKWRRVERKAQAVIRAYGLRVGAADDRPDERVARYVDAAGLRVAVLKEAPWVSVRRTRSRPGYRSAIMSVLKPTWQQIHLSGCQLQRLPSHVTLMLGYYWQHRRRVFGIACEALKGDSESRKRIKRSLRSFVTVFTGFRITRD